MTEVGAWRVKEVSAFVEGLGEAWEDPKETVAGVKSLATFPAWSTAARRVFVVLKVIWVAGVWVVPRALNFKVAATPLPVL